MSSRVPLRHRRRVRHEHGGAIASFLVDEEETLNLEYTMPQRIIISAINDSGVVIQLPPPEVGAWFELLYLDTEELTANLTLFGDGLDVTERVLGYNHHHTLVATADGWVMWDRHPFVYGGSL